MRRWTTGGGSTTRRHQQTKGRGAVEREPEAPTELVGSEVSVRDGSKREAEEDVALRCGLRKKRVIAFSRKVTLVTGRLSRVQIAFTWRNRRLPSPPQINFLSVISLLIILWKIY
jgi:hypothetical protein